MKLRPYQGEAYDRVRAALSQHDSTLVEMATGLGKTVLFARLAADWPGRVCVVAHREELIQQAADKVAAVTGGDVGIEMGLRSVARDRDATPKVVVTSVQTMCRESRQEPFDPNHFGLLVIDEAHHSVSQSYRRVIDFFRRNDRLKLLGVTATPKRADQLALGQVFESVAFQYGIEPAIDDGWLVPVRQQVVKVDGLDFSQVRTVAGDFNESDLEKILTEEKPLHQVCASLVEIAGDLPALVFCVSVKHAQLIAGVLNRYKPGSAEALWGDNSPAGRERRRNVVADYKAGKVQFLCNCALFTEGFDAPSTALVVMARPTKSIVLYVQVLGRGTRPLPGVVDGLESADLRKAAIAASRKPYMVALDYVGNSGRHKVVTSFDVLGGKYGEAVRAYATDTAEAEGRPFDIAAALGRAEAEMDLERLVERERRRREIVKARAAYHTRDVSPFDSRAAVNTATADRPRGEPATEKQVRALVRCGHSLDFAQTRTKRQASAILAKEFEKRGWGQR